MRRANCVRNIKNAISNTFGKVFIEDIPGQKASMDEIKKWKNSTNVIWARDNLWSQVNESKKMMIHILTVSRIKYSRSII